MAPPDPLPQYVYKILPEAPPKPIPEEFPLSDLDKESGFVHFSIADEVPHTALRFFGHATELWVLKVVLGSELQAKMNWDFPRWPHLYANFGIADIESARKFERPSGREWTADGVMDRSWLK